MTPDFSKHPRMHGMLVYEVLLEAGDVLFIPEGWGHQALNLEWSLMISSNYVDQHNGRNMVEWTHYENVRVPCCLTLCCSFSVKCALVVCGARCRARGLWTAACLCCCCCGSILVFLGSVHFVRCFWGSALSLAPLPRPPLQLCCCPCRGRHGVHPLSHSLFPVRDLLLRVSDQIPSL